MNPNLLAGQVDLPRRFEQQVVDSQKRPIPVPSDPQGSRMDRVPLIFTVAQDKQPIQVPAQLMQDQDLDQEQAQRIWVTEVAAVPVVQERQQAS